MHPLINFLILMFIVAIVNRDDIYNYFTYKSISYYTISDNLVKIINDINSDTYMLFLSRFMEISKTHNKIYIYIDSPGGQVYYSNKIIEAMLLNKNKTIICIAENAASSAFSLFQYCHIRYVTPNSYLMQHNALLRLGDISFDEMRTQCDILDLLESYVMKSHKHSAKRIGITLKDFLFRINFDWKITGGYNIVKQNLADDIIRYNKPDT